MRIPRRRFLHLAVGAEMGRSSEMGRHPKPVTITRHNKRHRRPLPRIAAIGVVLLGLGT
jgi:hypothetical protein